MEEATLLKIRSLLGPTDSSLCGDFTNYAVIIGQIFKSAPPPLGVKGSKVEVPMNYTVKIGGSKRVYSILGDPELFEGLHINLRKGILDVMSLLLARGTTYVVRFQCHNSETVYSPVKKAVDHEDNTSSSSHGAHEGGDSLTRILLSLLEVSRKNKANIDVSKRIVHLLGLTAAAGLSIHDNRDVLALLRKPSELTISLLQAFKNMTRLDNQIVKANPHPFSI